MSDRKPIILVIAGPNGSGKSTITQFVDIVPPYINADDIKRTNHCTDLEAAQLATSMREQCVAERRSFSFETVLSSPRNLDLLRRAKEAGYFIKCFYIFTSDVNINITRVMSRHMSGGHDVPRDKIISRYEKALAQLPELLELCDILHLYDNTSFTPARIFKKKKSETYFWPTPYWPESRIRHLLGLEQG